MPVAQPISEYMCRSLGLTAVESWWVRWRSVWSYIGADAAMMYARSRR